MHQNHCEISYKGDPPRVFCPACGKEVTVDGETCDHVAFTYLYEIGKFAELAPHIEAEYGEELKEIEQKERDSVEEALELIDIDSLLCMTVTTSGVACGPASSTYSAAFDYKPSE